jgi:hypothetical protein
MHNTTKGKSLTPGPRASFMRRFLVSSKSVIGNVIVIDNYHKRTILTIMEHNICYAIMAKVKIKTTVVKVQAIIQVMILFEVKV